MILYDFLGKVRAHVSYFAIESGIAMIAGIALL